jgi:hypothetical protein
LFVAGGDELEEQVGGVLAERDVADLVDDDQPVAANLLQLGFQGAGVAGGAEAGGGSSASSGRSGSYSLGPDVLLDQAVLSQARRAYVDVAVLSVTLL